MDDEVPTPVTPDGDEAPEAADAAPGAGPVATPAAPVILYSEPLPGPRKRRMGWVLAAVAVVVIAAVGVTLGVASTNHTASPPAPSASPNKVVLTAIDSTLGAKTADVHMTILMTVPGQGQITATGSGVMDFTNNAARVTIGYQGEPQLAGVSLTELFVGGGGYLSVTDLSEIVPGKSWVALPVTGASVAPGSSNPADMFQILQSQGDQVTSLGASQVNGSPVDGYHVVIPEAAIQKRLSGVNLPAGMAQAAQGMFGPGGISMDVYVDSATGLMRRLTTDLTLTVAGQSVTAKATEDTSNFGVPVSITAPPADQVASFQQFSQAASSALGSTSGG
jgi:hypothetical protein